MAHTWTKNGSRRGRLVLYPTALLLIAGILYAGFIYEPEPDTAQLIGSAELLAKVGGFDEAAEICDRVLERDGENVHAWLILGMIAEGRRDHEEALDIYRRCLGLIDDADVKRDITLSMADIRRRQGEFEEALVLLDALEERRGELPSIERLRGVVALDRSDLAAAHTHIERFRLLDPENTEADTLMVNCLIKMSRLREAREVLSRLSAEERRAWPLWSALARSCLEAGDRSGATSALARFTELDGNATRKLQKDDFWSRYADDAEFRGLLN